MTAPKWYAVITLALLTVVGLVVLARLGAVEYQDRQQDREREARERATAACLEQDERTALDCLLKP